MMEFLQRFSSQVRGVLSGLNRIRFRRTKRPLSTVGCMLYFLRQQEVLHKVFKTSALDVTQTLVTDFKRRPEGVRLLYRVNRNWFEIYDKRLAAIPFG